MLSASRQTQRFSAVVPPGRESGEKQALKVSFLKCAPLERLQAPSPVLERKIDVVVAYVEADGDSFMLIEQWPKGEGVTISGWENGAEYGRYAAPSRSAAWL